MVSSPTVATGNSPAKFSQVVITNMAGQLARVDSVSTGPDEVTVDSLDIVNLVGEYSAGNPGMLVIVSGQSAADEGKTANITGITGTTISIDVDLSTALGADDVVAVVPPLANELNTNGGHTLGVTVNKDEELGITEGVLTHNSMLSYDTGGSLPIFASIDSPGLGRLLLAGIGTHKVATSLHSYVPAVSNDGTFDENDELTVYTQDGNGVTREAWLGLMGTQFTVEVPRRGVANMRLDTQGTEVLREVGGTGKDFPSGASNWNTGTYPCDTGKRFAARGALIQLGGSFGDPLDKSLMDPYFQEVTITGTRQPTDVTPLGTPARAKPEEDTYTFQVTGRRLLEDDTIYDDFYGSGATPDDQTETRMLIKIVNPQDETKFLRFDVPLGTYNVVDRQRQRGQFEEQFTFMAHHTTDASGCIDTATPLFQCDYENGDTTDYAAAVA